MNNTRKGGVEVSTYTISFIGKMAIFAESEYQAAKIAEDFSDGISQIITDTEQGEISRFEYDYKTLTEE